MKADASSDAEANEEPEEVTDTVGLRRAYSSPNRLYRNRDTLYVAGTIDFSDVTDDWIKIPFQQVPNIHRFKVADQYLSSTEGQGIKRLVGHSLGAVTAAELGRQRNIPVTQYGAPVFDPIPRNPFHRPDRTACRFDPVAIMDFGARKVDCIGRANQHNYSGLENFRKHSYFRPFSFF
jgi:hypothetical protein